jgi:Fe2+ or Zn2+ uptake regulation protein
MSDLVATSLERLHAQGGRMTAQRRLILETLVEMSSHPTAEELFQLAQESDPSLHLSTVYRTLRWLEQEGLVQTRLFNDARRQERFDPTPTAEHYHFVCTGCKSVIEFDNLLVNVIKAQFELHSGAEVDSGSVTLYGLCAACRSSARVTNPDLVSSKGQR